MHDLYLFRAVRLDGRQRKFTPPTYAAQHRCGTEYLYPADISSEDREAFRSDSHEI